MESLGKEDLDLRCQERDLNLWWCSGLLSHCLEEVVHHRYLAMLSWCLGKFSECQGLWLKCHQLMMGVTRLMRLMTTIQLRQPQETVKSEDKVVVIFMYTFNFQVPLQAIAFLSFSLTLEEIFDLQKYPFLVGTVLRTIRSWMLILDLVPIQTQGLIPTPKLQTMKGRILVVICKLENLNHAFVLRQDVELILVLLLFKVNGSR